MGTPLPLIERGLLTSFFGTVMWTEDEINIAPLVDSLPAPMQEMWDSSHHPKGGNWDPKADRRVWISIACFSDETSHHFLVREEGQESEFRNRTIAVAIMRTPYSDSKMPQACIAIRKATMERNLFERRPVPAELTTCPELN